ncbi:hypothetical protein ACFL5O_03435 [Myxococcota bacterium]
MRKSVLSVALSVGLLACSTDPSGSNGGLDAGSNTEDSSAAAVADASTHVAADAEDSSAAAVADASRHVAADSAGFLGDAATVDAHAFSVSADAASSGGGPSSGDGSETGGDTGVAGAPRDAGAPISVPSGGSTVGADAASSGGGPPSGDGFATGGNTGAVAEPGNAGTPSNGSSGGSTGGADTGVQPGSGGADAALEPAGGATAGTGAAVSTGGSGGAQTGSDPTVLTQLQGFLETARAERTPIEDQAFAETPLTKEQAEQAAELLWQDWADHIRETRQAEHAAKAIVLQEKTLRYDFTVFGDKPAVGRSLFISLHGGGNADPSVNDSQWENQKLLYQPDEGIYLCPRAPTNTWNLWHEAHIDPMFERLIGNFIVLEEVNPDRVYVMGYSAGGDGVYQIGPRMADHWAAASMMAGHPNEAKPFSLRNIGFTIHVGERDTDYDRNLKAQEWSDQLDELEAADPGGYAHEVQIHPGLGHSMNLEDAVAVPWMAQFTRNPTPNKIVWYQDDITHGRFYWLSMGDAQAVGETQINATLEGQRIALESSDVPRITVRLSDSMLDLDQPVSVTANGTERFNGIASRTIAELARSLEERGDPRLVFSAAVAIEM